MGTMTETIDIEDFFRDTDAISAGRWIGDIPNCGPMRLKVRGTKSPEFEDALSARLRALPMSARDSSGSVPQRVIRQCEREAAADALLLDWDGLSSKGAPVTYTKPIAKSFINNPSGVFFAAVMWAAQRVDETRAAEEEAITGN